MSNPLPDYELREPDLRAAFDKAVLDSLRPVSLGLGALFAVFAVAHMLVLPPALGRVMSPLAAFTAAAMFGLRAASSRWPIPTRWANPLAALVAALVLLNSLLHLYLAADPLQTTNILLFVVGAGFLLLSTSWLAVVMGFALAAWLLIVLMSPPTPAWSHFGFAMLSASVLAVIVHAARVRIMRRLEGLRLRDELRKAELEAAYQGEQARRQLSDTLYEIGRALSGTLDLTEVLDLILERLAGIVPYDRSSVMLPTTRGDAMEFVASKGFPAGASPQMRILIKENDIFEQIYRTQKPLLIPDVSKWPGWQYVPGLPDAQSWMGLPLVRANQVIGMVSLTRVTLDPYTEQDAALAVTFAGQAAVALDNARLYDQLRRAFDQLEKLDRAKSDFISVIAHELRTPLTVMRGSSQMLLNDKTIQANEFHRELVASVFSGTVRLHEIVNAILDMSKIDSRALRLYPAPVSVPGQIRLACEEFEAALAERNLTLRVEDLSGLPEIEADADLLRKVLHQLIVNAIKYTPDGGSITISGRAVLRGQYNMPEDGVEIIVSDTGIGIDPEYHELIFAKFYQTGEVALHSSGKTKFKGGGPGLGLAIAKGIVEAHGGKIWAESQAHDEERCPGSHFHVVLPLRNPKVSRSV